MKKRRIKYDKILVFAVRKLIGSGEQIRFLKNIELIQSGVDITLKEEWGCLNYTEIDGEVDITINNFSLASGNHVEGDAIEDIRRTTDKSPQFEQIKKNFCKNNCIGNIPKPSNECMRMYWPESSITGRKKYRVAVRRELFKLRKEDTQAKKEDSQKALANVRKFTDLCTKCPSKRLLKFYIKRGEQLESIYSLNRKFMAIMKEGDLKIVDLDINKTVKTFTSNDKDAFAEIDAQGYFRLSNSRNSNQSKKPFVSSSHCSNPDCRLVLSDDGRLELMDFETYRVVWRSENLIKSFIEVGEYMENHDNYIVSPNNKYYATVKDSGVFGVWNYSDIKSTNARAVWKVILNNGNTVNARARLVLEANGDLTLYSINKSKLWGSDTAQKENMKYRLVLTDEGKLNVFHPYTNQSLKTIN